MAQKVIGAIVVIGLIWAGYMAFFTEKKEVVNKIVTPIVEEPQTSTGVTVVETKTGIEHFATKNGMTLYTYNKDDFGVSNCSGDCLMQRAVFYSSELLAADGFGSITRTDGAQQSTYLERPLYTYSQDQKAGDTKGYVINGEWSLATFSK
jgi:predicted lipoprotein with Yx(FWY)xxD motif